MTEEQSRQQFEAWYQADIVNWAMRFHRDGGKYAFSGTEKAWQAWQASRAALKKDDRSTP
jgi:hypothetical protein